MAVVVGFGLDSLLFQLRLLESPYERFWALGPLWLMALWMSFATTVRHSLRWLNGRPILQASLGLIGGPLAYLTGESLGAITVNGLWGTVAVMAVYSVTVPALFLTASVASAKVAQYGRQHDNAQFALPLPMVNASVVLVTGKQTTSPEQLGERP